LVAEVKKLVLPFENSSINFFSKNHHHSWTALNSKFKREKEAITAETTKLITETFRDLRSAEGAFDLL
jgi:dynein heavy chain